MGGAERENDPESVNDEPSTSSVPPDRYHDDLDQPPTVFVLLSRISDDLARVEDHNQRGLAKVGIGMVAAAGIGTVGIQWFLDAPRHSLDPVAATLFQGALLFLAASSLVQLAGLQRHRRSFKFELPWRPKPGGVLEEYPPEGRHRFKITLRVVLILVATFFATMDESPFPRWQLQAVSLVMLLEIALRGVESRTNVRILKVRPLPEFNEYWWQAAFDLIGHVLRAAVAVLGAFIVFQLSDAHFSPGDERLENLRLVVAVAAFLTTLQFALFNFWRYDSGFRRTLATLRTLLAAGKLKPEDAYRDYLYAYATGKISPRLALAVTAWRNERRKRRLP